MITKVCSKCGIEKTVSEFNKYSKGEYGVRAACKQCMSEYRKANKEKIQLQKHIWFQKNKEHVYAKRKNLPEEVKVKRAKAKAEWSKKNLDKIRDQGRINRLKRKEHYTLKAKEWAEKNKDKIKVIKNNYKHKRREIERSTPIPSNELHRWEKEQIKICSYCGCDCIDNYHIDHIEPLSTGGGHSIDNLTIACPTCNLSKNNKSMIIWMIQNRVRGGSFNAE